MENEQWLGVKELADIVGVSRQTLIYYDSIDLFKPEFIDKNGYRKYSSNQIMELREILFLKNNNIPLEFIKANMKKKSLDSIKSGLKASREKLLKDIENLNRKVEKINNRIYSLERAGVELYTVSIPLIKYFPERRLFMMPWETTAMNRARLYQTFMDARRELAKMNLSDDLGWGAFFRGENVNATNNWLEGGGGFIYLPLEADIDMEKYAQNVKVLPAGEYLCMNRFDMPYKRQAVDELLKWAKNHDVKTVGDMIDECLLDTTFQKIADSEVVDFSQIQIRIER